MNNPTLNITPEASTNSTTQAFGLVEYLNIFTCSFDLLFGLPTHSYIIWLIISGAGSGVASEFFILNLSICENGISFFCLTFALEKWFSWIVAIKLFLIGLVITGHPLFQSLICVERYLAVVHPVTFLKSKPLRYRLICCAVVWILVLGSCLCCLYTVNTHRTVHVWFLTVQFLLFFSIQLFCLVAVLRALKQSGPADRKREEENHMKRRAFQIILITVSMVATYFPYNAVGFFTIISGTFSDASWVPGFICYVLCSFVHPVFFICIALENSPAPVSYKKRAGAQ